MSDFMLEVDPEDWWKRTKENPSDPLEEIRQLHESFLAELEGLTVEAIATNNWDAFYAHVVNFQNEHDLHGESGIAIAESGASTKVLSRPGADSISQTELTLDKD